MMVYSDFCDDQYNCSQEEDEVMLERRGTVDEDGFIY